MKVVLAYSGGLDTSVILKWLQDKYKAEVICYTSDLGQKIDKKAIYKNAKVIILENLQCIHRPSAGPLVWTCVSGTVVVILQACYRQMQTFFDLLKIVADGGRFG